MKKMLLAVVVVLVAIFATGCQNKEFENFKNSKKLKVVTTTTMLTDAVKNIGKDSITVHGIIKPGVDPHLYEFNINDRKYFEAADVIVMSGFHLEAHIDTVIKESNLKDKLIVATNALVENTEIKKVLDAKHKWVEDGQETGDYDPHFWFNIDYFGEITKYITLQLELKDKVSADKSFYKNNFNKYAEKLLETKTYLQTKIDTLPKEKRFLFTAHDAFNYFAEMYNFTVIAVQGISTESQVVEKDLQASVDEAIKHNVSVCFIESTIPAKTLEKVQELAKNKNHTLRLSSKDLLSDSLGAENEEGSTYIEMMKYNVDLIVSELLK